MKYQKYEKLKRKLQELGLSPAQYECVLRLLAEALGV